MFLLILIGFLLFDASRRLFDGGQLLFHREDGISDLQKHQLFENLVVATFYLLLFLQILLRTLAARIWGTLVFLLHLVWLVIRYGINQPEEWLALSHLGRLQLFTQILFFTAAIILLNRSPTRDVLRG